MYPTPTRTVASRRPFTRVALLAALALGVVAVSFVPGCARRTVEQQVTEPRYPALPVREVPPYLAGSLFQQVDVFGVEPLRVSGYGLVTRLENTGSNQNINFEIRQYMLKELARRGIGDPTSNGPFRNVSPERVLQDPQTAVVRVDAFIPPGARVGQRFDAQVSVLQGNPTTSLTGGLLYRTDLKRNGAAVASLSDRVNTVASSRGFVFVNPVYALQPPPTGAEGGDAAAGLRYGVVLDGARAEEERPIGLRLRQPSLQLARGIEKRLNITFGVNTAKAMDEGIVMLSVPPRFSDNWEHFVQVARHTYFNTSDAFVTVRAEQLAEAARQPGAPLQNISYALEALGERAMPFLQSLMAEPDDSVAFAAARAAAFLNDRGAIDVLYRITIDAQNPHQVAAVETLADLPRSAFVDQRLRELLDVEQSMVRVAAYRALVGRQDPTILTRIVRERFMLDIVPSDGPPMVYASREGTPRIALFGNEASLQMPAFYSAIDARFTMTSRQDQPYLTLFYRDPLRSKPVSVLSRPALPEIIARLGGEAAAGEQAIDFDYARVVAVLQELAARRLIHAPHGPAQVPVAFQLQTLPGVEDAIENAPPIPTLAEQAANQASAR
ncbi:MAG: flagellar basal body P-ring protein FlgI [Phycisphaerae bacterium]